MMDDGFWLDAKGHRANIDTKSDEINEQNNIVWIAWMGLGDYNRRLVWDLWSVLPIPTLKILWKNISVFCSIC